jgi:hypothetical protein
VFFITDDQKPDWLNIDHPKLKWIKHTEYIPEEYLPAFSSHVIEWNLHRIDELSENFVYFNDDVFLIKNAVPEDFFVEDLSCDMPKLSVLYPLGFFSHILFNNAELINRNFSLNKSILENKFKWIKGQPPKELIKLLIYGRKPFLCQCESYHIHMSLKKSNFKKLWEKEFAKIDGTCKNCIRTKDDISIWCVRDWQLLSGEFYPKKPIGKSFHTASMSYSDEAINYLRKQKGKVICLNDSEDETEFELHKQMILAEFEKLMPEKSSFEL